MTEEDFYNWFKDEAGKEISYAVDKKMDSAMGDKKQKAFALYPAYQQDKIFRETKKLVNRTHWLTIATWVLAVATIILIIKK